MQFLLDFKRHAPRLGWDTPVLLFENLEALLQGAALTQWQVASFGLDVNEPDSFEEALDNRKGRKNLNYDAMRDQLDYMRRVRKPREYTPEEFIQRLQHVNLMIPQFIDATEDNMLTDNEIKEKVYRGMPSEWRKNFANSGKKVYSESLETIESYMSTQSDLEGNKKAKIENNNNNQNNNKKEMATIKTTTGNHITTTTIRRGTIIIITTIIIRTIIIIIKTEMVILSPAQKPKINVQSMSITTTNGANVD